MKTNLLLSIVLGVLVLVACKKPTEPIVPIMPPLTHIGANTFGCYVDGELYVANEGDEYWDLPALSGSFNETTRDLRMQSKRRINNQTGEGDDITMLVTINDGIGTHNFRYNKDGGTVGYMNWYGGKCRYYYREYPGFDVGKITITHLDEEKNIIAGTFYMNLVNENCDNGDTLMKITDGRFDFKY